MFPITLFFSIAASLLLLSHAAEAPQEAPLLAAGSPLAPRANVQGPLWTPTGRLLTNKDLDRIRRRALESDRPTKIPRRSYDCPHDYEDEYIFIK